MHIHDAAFYPYANTSGGEASYGSISNPDAPNIVNVAVPPHTDSATFRQLFRGIVEKVTAFQPSILFISGAFCHSLNLITRTPRILNSVALFLDE